METFGECFVEEFSIPESLHKTASCKSFSASSPCSTCQRLSSCPFRKKRDSEKQRMMEEARKYSMVGLF